MKDMSKYVGRHVRVTEDGQETADTWTPCHGATERSAKRYLFWMRGGLRGDRVELALASDTIVIAWRPICGAWRPAK
jgi:hypothetical protein